jgi:hypothetical protein
MRDNIDDKRKDFAMRRWIVLAIAIFTIACLGTATPTPEVPGVESITTPDAIPECQPAASVAFKLQKISDTFVEVIASGLQPGKRPMFIIIRYRLEKEVPIRAPL